MKASIRIREIKLLLFIIIFTLILIVPSIIDANETNFNYNTNFFVTNGIIGLVALNGIFRETRKSAYSLHLIHWIFQYTFFFIAPLIQYLNLVFPWDLLNPADTNLLLKTNLTILIWQMVWLIPYSNFIQKPNRSYKTDENKIASDLKDKKFLYVSNLKIATLFALSFIVLAYLIYLKGFAGLFIRLSAEGEGNQIGSSAVWTILMYSGRAIPIVLMVLMIFRLKHKVNTVNVLLSISSMAMVLLTNFPISTPRFWTAAVTLGLFLTFFKVKSKNFLVYAMFFGLSILFPLLGSVRSTTSFDDFLERLDMSRLFSANFLTADYDAYSMIAYTYQYIDFFGATNGKQVLTALFFFVPRSLWESKSVGSGNVVAENLNFVFANVSSPMIAEGLINFGIVGVLLFSVILSFICKEIDIMYHLKRNTYILMVYPFLIGLFFYMLRGDMLSSFSFTTGFVISFILFRPVVRNKKLEIQRFKRKKVGKSNFNIPMQ